MHTCVALFRGINVGGRNILPMNDLVTLLHGLGYANVRTYIQSGNVVLDSTTAPGREQAAEIADAVSGMRGFRPGVLLLSAAEFQRAVEGNSFPTDDGRALHLYFLDAPPERPDWGLLESRRSGSERFELCGDVFYLYAPAGVGRSKLAASVERALGVSATARNWNTVQKLQAMVGGV